MVHTNLFMKLILLFNPLLISLIYYSLKPSVSLKESVKDSIIIVLSSSSIAICIIFFGEDLINFFGVGLESINLAGGVLIVMIAISMLKDGAKINSKQSQSSIITPIVVPICIGGATISIILTSISHLPFKIVTFLAFSFEAFAAFFIVAIFCVFAKFIMKHINFHIITLLTILSLFIILSIGIGIIVDSLKILFVS